MNKIFKLFLFVFLYLQLSSHALAQTFQNLPVSATGLNNYSGFLIAADLNNDGSPEIIVTGTDGFTVLANDSAKFNQQTSYPNFKGESQVFDHTLDVGDIDRDGFIDILQSGGPNNRVFRILINKDTGFVDISNNIITDETGAAFLGDFDADGDLDIIYSSVGDEQLLGGVLLNGKGSFYQGPLLTGGINGILNSYWSANWCDLDHDSQLEVVESVFDENYFVGNYLLKRGYPNMQIEQTLNVGTGLYNVCFADYDGDGDFDMLAKQETNILYNNVDGNFVNSGISFPASKTAEFADVNNDGLYDVIIGGMMTTTWQVYETGIYLNQNNGTFVKLDAQIPAFENCSASIADIDGDGDLDIPTQNGIYINNCVNVNQPPSAPATMSVTVSGSAALLSWQAGSDDSTPISSLTYNIAVRSEDGTIIVPGNSLPSGKRQIYKLGNAYNNLSFNLSCLKQGTYYWKVQTLDASYVGSNFSAEQSFTITNVPPVAPVNLTATTVSDVRIDLSWTDESLTEDGFIIFRSSGSSVFSAIDTVLANVTHYVDTSYLVASTPYTYRVVASNCAYPDDFATIASATTFPPAYVDSQWLNLGGVYGSMVSLADYDNDGDLDMLAAYSAEDYSSYVKLFRFDGDSAGYVDSGIQFTPPGSSSIWFDYNNDGFIDLLLNGSMLYQNVGGASFVQNKKITIPSNGLLSLGDYDNDGDEDMAVQSGISSILIYDNNGKGQFTLNKDINNLSGNMKSSYAWADYDRDGDLDLIANQIGSSESFVLVLFENNGDKSFTPVVFSSLTGINDDYLNYTGDMKWGDYDNDGYPDLLVAGENTNSNEYGISNIYHNNGDKTFSLAASLVRLIYDVCVDWGDYDNDGDLDVFMYGDPFGPYADRTRVYSNNEGTFKETNITYLIESLQYGKSALGDIDRDGDLDYVILGEVDYVTPRIIVYRNNYAEKWGKPNRPPSAPQGLISNSNSDGSITISWSPSTDDETPAQGLTYNAYIIDDNDSIVLNSYSLSNGYRKIVSSGNTELNDGFTIKNLKTGTYQWGVQSIDKGFMGSEFSPQSSFSIVVTEIEQKENSVTLFPNPTSSRLNISTQGKLLPSQIDITNSIGQRVISSSIEQGTTTLDVSALPSGLYIITIYDNKGSKLTGQKIIKI